MFYSSFHESSNGASGWSLVLSLPQSPTQPLLSLLLPCVSLDIDNKIIIAVMRLVGLHLEVLVMSLHSMHIFLFFFKRGTCPCATRSAFIQCFWPTMSQVFVYSLILFNKQIREVNCDFENTPVLSII
jgi:hypothetical protein